MNLKNIYTGFLLLPAFSLPAYSIPVDYGKGIENFSSSYYLKNQDGDYNYWNGIGVYKNPGQLTCTAFLIDTNSSDASDSAYALTSAHCVGKENGVMRIDDPIEGTITFNHFNDTPDARKAVPLKKVAWSSIQGVDVALLELGMSQGELLAQGITPMKLAEQSPAEDTDILIVHGPGGAPLRISACTHVPSPAIFEKPWVWRHSLSNQCKDVASGSSGSPVIVRATNEVYGVLGTLAAHLTPLPGYGQMPSGSYGSSTSVFNNCFINGKLNTNPQVCELFPAASIRLPAELPMHAKISVTTQGSYEYPAWNFEITASTRFIRTKRTADSVDCEKPEGYSQPINSDTRPTRLNIPMGPETGTNNLCIIATDDTSEVLPAGTYRNAVTVPTYLIDAGPTPAPALDAFYDKETDRVIFLWPKRNNEGIDRYEVKAGPADTTRCDDPQGYTVPKYNWVRRESNFPMKFCMYALDTNNQRSVLKEYNLQWETLKNRAP
ncbi:serine protease [Pseudomonas fluorescens]|uniref:S1 family peptidase n=1 Tax=Pseudomonas fluorescens TaxID=294 RepID=UPI00380666ED